MLCPEPQPWIRLDGSEIKPGDPDFVDEPPAVDDLAINAPLHSMLMGPPATGMTCVVEAHRPYGGGLGRSHQADKNEYAAWIEQQMIAAEEREFQRHLVQLASAPTTTPTAAVDCHKEDMSDGKRRFERYISEQAAAAAHPVERVTTAASACLCSHIKFDASGDRAIMDRVDHFTIDANLSNDDADEPPPLLWHDTDEPPPLEWDIEAALHAYPDDMVERPTEASLAMARQMLTNLSKYCVQTGPDTSLLGHVGDIHWTLNGRCWITFKNGLNMFQEYENPESWFVVEKACTIKKLGGVRGLASCVLFACFNDKHDH